MMFSSRWGWSGELGYAFRIHGQEFAWAVVALPEALRWAQGLLSYSNVSSKNATVSDPAFSCKLLAHDAPPAL